MTDAVLPTVSEDDAAMRRVAEGDSAALAQLFERHKKRLFGFLYHLLGDHAAAEDLLSETFLRVYRARESYRVGCGFLPWLFRIARNLAVGELRRRAVLSRGWERLKRDAAASDEEWQPERDETRERVRRALLRLPEDQRSALVLKEYQELSYREIAQVLGCSEEAARARTYRARITLREALREWWEDGVGPWALGVRRCATIQGPPLESQPFEDEDEHDDEDGFPTPNAQGPTPMRL